MSEEERGFIMEALKSLPIDCKQFVLGYAAGVAACREHGENHTAGASSDAE